MDGLRLGIAGLGRGFMLTLPALRSHPGVQLAAGFDLRADAVARFAEEFDAQGYNSLEALIADSGIDAIYIATPHELHAEQTMAVIEAGKHVLVEKPMATSVEDCLRMARLAETKGRVLIVGPSHGFDAPVRAAADLVASGRYGDVGLVTALNFTDFMYRPRRPEELNEARGGGVVYSQATHQIDVVRRIVGQPVETIRAVTGNWDAARHSAGAYTALMTFAGGAAASLTYSGYAHYDSDELVGWISELGGEKDASRYGEARKALAALPNGDEADAKLARTYGAVSSSPDAPKPHNEHFGFILVSCARADLKVLPTGIEIYADTARDFVEVPPPAIPRVAVIDEFAAAIAGERAPVHDGAWGVMTMACCAALIRSSRDATDIAPADIIQDASEKLTP